MNFQITLVGLNHRTASVDVRERYALAPNGEACGRLVLPADCISEFLILSTCNRVELLCAGESHAQDALLECWAKACLADPLDLGRHIYTYANLDAARHVFNVASSLDSMVLGEPQILGQMKSAYRLAVEKHSTGPILNRLMHKAFSVAKRVRHETAVAASAVSISYAAVELARRIFGSMPTHRAMLIGAGEMAELAATHLVQAGIDEIFIINRTFTHAEELARRFHGIALPFASLADSLRLADIIIASTGSEEPLLNPAHVKNAMRARKNRPMFFIDIAVPRDIDPAINNIDNVYLYDIDDLRDVVEENMAARREEAERARLIIEEEVEYFGAWLRNLDAKPTILDLIRRGDEACAAELARTLKRLGPVSPQVREALELLAHGIARRLNHDPLMYLKRGGMGRAGQHGRISEIRRIFNLDPNSGGS